MKKYITWILTILLAVFVIDLAAAGLTLLKGNDIMAAGIMIALTGAAAAAGFVKCKAKLIRCPCCGKLLKKEGRYCPQCGGKI